MCVLGFIAGLVFSVIGLLTPEITATYPDGDGCVATSGASCAYRARDAGSIYAVGNEWGVEIVRGTRTIKYGPDGYADILGGVEGDREVIRAGDLVRAWTGETSPPFGGLVSVGDAIERDGR